jgi:tetratricopeptide (TPR) repeat protein
MATVVFSATVGSLGALLAVRLFATPTLSLDQLQTMVGRGDSDAAIPQLKQYLRRDRTNSRAHLILAGAYHAQENYDEAIEHLLVIPDRSIWAVEARVREGMVRLRAFGQAVQAESLWEKAVAIDEVADPTSISEMGRSATVELLTLYLFQHRKRDASAVIWRWHGRASPENRSRAALALLALEFGPGPAANDRIADLEKWSNTDSTDASSRRALGRAYVELGSKAESGLAMLRDLVNSYPQDIDNWVVYLTALAEYGDVNTMRDVVASLPPAANQSADCWQQRGMMHEMSQQWNEAADCFLKALEYEPTRPETCAHLSYVLRRCNQTERALKYEQLGNELNAVEDQLHSAYDHLTASQARPDGASAYRLGELYEKRGHLREARVWYEDAARLRPNDQQAGEAMDRVGKLLSSGYQRRVE